MLFSICTREKYAEREDGEKFSHQSGEERRTKRAKRCDAALGRVLM